MLKETTYKPFHLGLNIFRKKEYLKDIVHLSESNKERKTANSQRFISNIEQSSIS